MDASTKHETKGFLSVMNDRADRSKETPDLFLTPPWAVRALFTHLIHLNSSDLIWEPAAGPMIMADVLSETHATVLASDKFDYGFGAVVTDYLTTPWRLGDTRVVNILSPHSPVGRRPTWIITNPPFKHALKFTLKALDEATEGVAMLVRLNWLEGADRHRWLFSKHPPSIVAPFVERVPMHQGRWDPRGSTATAYAWIIWSVREPDIGTRVQWIPPGQRKRLTLPTDNERFAWRKVDL